MSMKLMASCSRKCTACDLSDITLDTCLAGDGGGEEGCGRECECECGSEGGGECCGCDGAVVVVGVKLDSRSRELLTWALVKISKPGDRVIALHVISPKTGIICLSFEGYTLYFVKIIRNERFMHFFFYLIYLFIILF